MRRRRGNALLGRVAALTTTVFGSRRSPRDRHWLLVNRGRVRATHDYIQIGKRERAKLLTDNYPHTNSLSHIAVEQFSEIQTIFVSYPPLSQQQKERQYRVHS